MKEFEVTITETLQKSVTVEAATREEAQAMVEEMWDKGDVVLDADNFVGADFSCDSGREMEENKSIEVLLVQPGQYAKMATIGADLKSMYEKNGQLLEKIIRNIVQVCFLRPKERPYETNNFYDLLDRQEKLDKEVQRIVRGEKAHKSRKKAD